MGRSFEDSIQNSVGSFREKGKIMDMDEDHIDDRNSDRQRAIAEQMAHYCQTGATITGTVKHVRFNDRNQFEYGFITPDDSMLNDVFVYWKQVEPWREGFKELKIDDIVRFKLAPGSKQGKWQAIDVEIARNQPGQLKFDEERIGN